MQIYILLRWGEEGFLDLLSMMSVNHSCQRDICQIVFKTTRFSPFELFWTYQKNFVLEELWKNLKKQEIDLFTLCSYIILKQNSYFPYFVFICSFAQIVKISHLLLERFSLLIFWLILSKSSFSFSGCLKYNSIHINACSAIDSQCHLCVFL